MRKKPDFLLLLSILVISGVLISHFVVIKQSDMRTANTSMLNTHYSQSNLLIKETQAQRFKSQDLARIDLLKQRIH